MPEADYNPARSLSQQAFDNPADSKFSITGPDIRMTTGAVIAVAMTLNELCTNIRS